MALSRRAYVGVVLTLADHTKIYNLLDLINTVIAAESKYDGQTQCSGTARELYIQPLPGNTGTIFIGDALLAAGGGGRASGELAKTAAPRHYGTGDTKSVDVGQMYVTPATDNDKLYVEVLVG